MLVFNGSATNTVIFNGRPTSGFLNGNMIWGPVSPYSTYTASGMLSASATGLDSSFVRNGTRDYPAAVCFRVYSISPEIASWVDSEAALAPPRGINFVAGSSWIDSTASASAHYNYKGTHGISANNLNNVGVAPALSAAFSEPAKTIAATASGNYSFTVPGRYDIGGLTTTGSSASNRLYALYHIGNTVAGQAATGLVTASRWSATFTF